MSLRGTHAFSQIASDLGTLEHGESESERIFQNGRVLAESFHFYFWVRFDPCQQ